MLYHLNITIMILINITYIEASLFHFLALVLRHEIIGRCNAFYCSSGEESSQGQLVGELLL